MDIVFSCIVQCFCMFCYSLSGTFPLACTLCLYSAGMPKHLYSAPHFKVGVQGTGAIVIYIIACLVTTSYLAKCFCKNSFCNVWRLRKFAPEVWTIICIFLWTKSQGIWKIIVSRLDALGEQKNWKFVFHKRQGNTGSWVHSTSGFFLVFFYLVLVVLFRLFWFLFNIL